MNQAPNQADAHDDAADAVVQHLARELAWLESVRSCLFDVRRGAARGDVPTLERQQREQARLAEEQLSLREERLELARRLAAQFGMGQRISIGAFAARLTGAQRETVITQRQHVLRAAREVGMLGRGTFQLLRQSDAMVSSVLAAITGVDVQETRYTATGRPHALPGRALVELRS
jgi:hypothetical protein